MSHARHQLESIHAMLAAGQRCVRLERHSLLLLGSVGGFIVGSTEYFITDDRFPDHTQRALALLLWLTVWLGGMASVDHWLTHRARLQRDETLPFAQAQITRAWWMLLGMGTLGSFAMFFYGGGAMIYALWIVLLGLGVYLFGLFSRPFIEWIGLTTILLGVTGLAAGLSYGATHWLAASCFAIGMPMAGWLNQRWGDAPLPMRGLILSLWLAAVVGPALILARTSFAKTPDIPALTLAAGPIGIGNQVLRLPADTPVLLRVDLDGPLLSASPQAGLAMTLSLPIEVALNDGVPDGRYRIANGPWHHIHDGLLDLNIDRLSPRLENGRPVVRAHAVFGKHFFPEPSNE